MDIIYVYVTERIFPRQATKMEIPIAIVDRAQLLRGS